MDHVWSAVEFSHLVVANHLKNGGIAVDATVGNGHDTLFLLDLVGVEGTVVGFDIQEHALQKLREKLQEHPLASRCHLEATTHTHLTQRLRAYNIAQVDVIMFNLGYLPGSSKEVRTQTSSTVDAVGQACELLTPGGVMTCVCYTGHDGAREERTAVREFVHRLDTNRFHAIVYEAIGRVNAPECVVVCKR